jgi:hypothetical protein
LILICICCCPVLVWHDIVYLPKEHYCFLNYTNLRVILWLFSNIFTVPLFVLSLIYLRITVYLRRQSHSQTLLVKQRQQRDLVVIRRIFITIGLLAVLGIPSFVFIIMFNITNVENPLFYRFLWFFFNFSTTSISFTMIIVIPQLKSIVMKKFQRNRVVPLRGTLAGAIPIRHITTAL